MSDTLYLTRARLRPDAPAAALRAVLVPDGATARTAAAHHLVWTLFGDRPDRVRDFLWRESEPGLLYLLSEREPVDQHGLFDLEPPKLFAPQLHAGDVLGFTIRVNATVARSSGPNQRGKPCDVLMDALKKLPQADRSAARPAILDKVAYDWFAHRSGDNGFALRARPEADGESTSGNDEMDWPLRVAAHRVMRIPRGRGVRPMSLGVLDVTGTLEVREPETFLRSLGRGFGRGKAFGCGLMLIRRIRGA